MNPTRRMFFLLLAGPRLDAPVSLAESLHPKKVLFNENHRGDVYHD